RAGRTAPHSSFCLLLKLRMHSVIRSPFSPLAAAIDRSTTSKSLDDPQLAGLYRSRRRLQPGGEESGDESGGTGGAPNATGGNSSGGGAGEGGAGGDSSLRLGAGLARVRSRSCA